MDDERYHLTLSLNGEVAMQGWWGSEATARRQHATWVQERGEMPGVRIILVDEQEHLVLASYPAAPTGLRD